MTNLDTIIENAALDMPVADAPNLPKRPGLWRIVSLVAVAAALLVSTWSILQSREASNVAALDRDTIALQQRIVRVADLSVPSGTKVAVLGLASSASTQDFDLSGTPVNVPNDVASVVALRAENDDLIGMALVLPDPTAADIEISARSTAQAILLLSPGILRPNLDESLANIGVIETDPAFEKLVAAVAANSNLSQNNEPVEQAFAEIADRLPATRPSVEQGCDSVIARNAYPSAGTCVQPEASGVSIANEQDRWALLFDGADGFTSLCVAISPTNVGDGSEVFVDSSTCSGTALLVAPGQVDNQGDNQQIIDDRVRAAGAIQQLHMYVGPLADLVGASSGHTTGAVAHIRRNAPDLVASLTLLIETDEEFAAALDVTRLSTTALDRHAAAISAARLMIKAADTTALIPNRVAAEDGHIDILDFYVRAGERMIAPRTDWRWEADAVGFVELGDGT